MRTAEVLLERRVPGHRDVRGATRLLFGGVAVAAGGVFGFVSGPDYTPLLATSIVLSTLGAVAVWRARRGGARWVTTVSWLLTSFAVVVVAQAAARLAFEARHPFPSTSEVDSLASGWVDRSRAHKEEALRSLLARLRETESVADDRVVQFAFHRLGDLYEATDDPLLIDVLDTTRIGGGFANEACGFYERVVKRESGRARLAAAGGGGIRRCVGISFSEAELQRLLEPRPRDLPAEAR